MQATKRITAVFLAFILTLGLFAASPMTARAATGMADEMADGTWAANPRYIEFGSYNGEPILWRVLEVYTSDGSTDDNNSNKTAFLVADDLLRTAGGAVETRQFHSSSNDWNNSDIYTFLNGSGGNQFLESFDTGEQGAIVTSSYTYSGGSSTAASSQVFLLSTDEVNSSAYFAGDVDRAVANTVWWLRSPGSFGNLAAYVYSGGGVSPAGGTVYGDFGVRPALKVNLSSVIFTSVSVSYGLNVEVDNGSGTKTSGAKVAVDPSSARSAEIFTDSTGLARFEEMPGGSYTVTVTKPGYVTKQQTVTVPYPGGLTISLTQDSDAVPELVNFGKYNGTTISWKVLDIDSVSNQALLLYDSPNFKKEFNSSATTTWSGSSLRAWLNGRSASGDFLHTDNFTAGEYAAITQTAVPEASTQDRVFLLSETQARGYLPYNDLRMYNSGGWWIISDSGNAGIVYAAGTIGPDYSGVTSTNEYTRPAMWVDLSNLAYNAATQTLEADITPPILTAGTVDRTGDTAATVKFTSDKGGKYYYTIAATAPADAQAVKTADGSSGVSVTANTEATITDPTGLAAGAQTIYIVVEDAAGNLSNVLSISIPAYVPPDTDAPTIVSVTPSGIDEELGGNIIVTFSESMKTTVGSVSLDNGVGALSGAWSMDTYANDTYTAAYSGLDWSTTYTITIEDFEDAAGNAMVSAHTSDFTTKAQPSGPDVSPTTLDLDLNGSATGNLTISLGQSGNMAAQADIIIDPANTGDISVDINSLLADGMVTVTGYRVVSGAALTVEFSSGDLATPTDISVTVNVTDSTPPAPTVRNIRLNQVTGGTASVSHTAATAGETISLDITSLQSYYSFVRWDVTPAVTWTSGSSASQSAVFTMPDADVTVTPIYSYYKPGSSSGSSSSDSSGSSSSPIITYPVSVTTKPDFPTTARLTLTSSPDKNNALSYTITKEMVQQAIDKVKEEAKKQGRDSYGYSMEFYFSTDKIIDSLNITINADALALLESAGIKEVSFITNTFQCGFDLAAIKELNKQSGGKAVTVSASRFSKLSDEAKKLIGSRPAWDVTISYKNGGNTAYISNLGKGNITMGMKYTPASGEKTGNLAVVYVPGSGKPQVLTESSYDNGWMIWQRSSLSVYGVGYIADAPAFTDTTNHWAKDNIDFVASRGLISGASATVFSPDTAITRADFLMALGKLSGADVSGYTTSSFTDVANTSAAMPYIEWAVKNGIVQGIGNNQFGPDRLITREDMAVMMVNYAKATGYKIPVSREKVTFADDSGISAYAKDAVTAIQQAGIITGRGNNQFAPKASSTRAEAATILRRFVELVIDEGTARGWVQNDAGQWQYINTNGKAVTSNWLTAGGNKYYFDDKGVMVYGKWLQIGGKWYYFDASGKLAVNTTIDGYEVGADGARK